MLVFDLYFLSVFQIRVVNAFQEPATTPAQMPLRARLSLASLASVPTSKSEPKVRVAETNELAEEPRRVAASKDAIDGKDETPV